MRAIVLLTSLLVVFGAQAQPVTVTALSSDDPGLLMPPVVAPDGRTLSYSVGIGSSAFRHRSDPPNVMWTVGDRGPNMTCGEATRLLGAWSRPACEAVRAGRYYPTPEYAPSIYRVELDEASRRFRVTQTIPLRSRSGKPVLGLLNPQTVASRDTGLDLNGQVLPYNADNVDLEAIVRLSDGTFWVAEEMGPSLAEVSPDGRILRRLVPINAADDYRDADTEIVPILPAVLSRRQGNRGFESLAISPNERFLIAIVQNPLANPDVQAFRQARNTRILKIDRVSLAPVGEWIYQLDSPQSFALDPSNDQSDPRISEMISLGPDRFLVLERTEGTTKLYEINLENASNILGSAFDHPDTRPTLEQENHLGPYGITPVRKILRFDTARDARDAPTKIEGMALLGDGALALINDNDFGIRGDRTQVLIVRGAVSADEAVWRR
jgi:hypothetical protein